MSKVIMSSLHGVLNCKVFYIYLVIRAISVDTVVKSVCVVADAVCFAVSLVLLVRSSADLCTASLIVSS